MKSKDAEVFLKQLVLGILIGGSIFTAVVFFNRCQDPIIQGEK